MKLTEWWTHPFQKWKKSFPLMASCKVLCNPPTHTKKKSKLEGNELKLQLGSRPGGIEGIHMTGAHFHTITATVMAVIGWIGPLISFLQPLFTPQTSLGRSEILPVLFNKTSHAQRKLTQCLNLTLWWTHTHTHTSLRSWVELSFKELPGTIAELTWAAHKSKACLEEER